ncbi:O-methylsterigmatocystin oxidoreductase [Grifola frondosa]|uniref:O-methylsterigmatocystin oxidoreductase n=1 Tax=Grifola frondosa TaxID=5627 RepID=A0A1C7M825_GRIFR|nr:O-methylsterigmatocystin oxidoreductase [Grifola frondosa]
MWIEYLSVIFVVLLGLLYWNVARRRSRPYFPGPPPLPIIGNIVPPGHLWKKLAIFSQQYGPMFSLRTFGKFMLVLNSAATARALLDGKSAIYWTRPMPKLIELAGMDRGVLFESDPNRLRQSRKMLNLILGPRQLETYRIMIEKYVVQFLHNLLESPEGFAEHARSVPGGIALETLLSITSPKLIDLVRTLLTLYLSSQIFRLFFPAWIQREAFSWRDQYTDMAEHGYKFTQGEIVKGTMRPSMISKALERPDEYSEYVIKYTSAQVYSGGADTTVSSILTFFSTMVLHPDVQRRAQAEIDQVVGSDRLPRYSDQSNLPYTNAVLTEIIRLFIPIPIIARVPAQDDVHNGCYISKDTLIVINLWAMMRDETVYPDPDAFKPERWLSKDRDNKSDPWSIGFGFGRRICPGRDLAEQILFTTVACILATFDISPATDENGNVVTPSGEFTDGAIIFPLPFKCNIRPRSPRVRDIIAEAVNAY